MGPSRKELLQRLSELILATHELTRAMNRSTRAFEAVRGDIAKLKRTTGRRRVPGVEPLARIAREHRVAAAMSATVTSLSARRQK